MSDKAFLVFAQLEYSHSGPEQGEGGCGKTSTLLGVASDEDIAKQMISVDHITTLMDENCNPLLHPLRLCLIPSNKGEVEAVTITLAGEEDDGSSWVNTLYWYVQEVPVNELLNNFEL